MKANNLFKIFLVSLFLFFPRYTLANSIYNRSPWPSAYQGLEVVKENTDFQDAAHPCNRTHGRSFSLTHADGFKLIGLSVYVYVPGEPTKFDRNFFHLSFANNNSILATYSAPIGLDNGGYTFEVFFPINININGGVSYNVILECLSDDPADPFRISESSRLDDGLITGYYDSTISQTNPYYMSGRKILFTTFSDRNALHFPSLVVRLPESTDKTPGVSSSPKYHPVIFVHGLGGDPTNFESDGENRNYVKLLTDLGYPRDYIHLYSYGYKYDSLKRVNVYNYQGDIKEISQGMEVTVNNLSDKYKADGGDGKVDIVGHSLGTLVTRYYLLTHKDNHKIRRFIAVGAPFKGSWVMGVDKGMKAVPLIGNPLENAVANFFLNNYNKGKSIQISKDSLASLEVTPSSDFLEGVNGINKTKINNLEAYMIYGDINTTIRQKVFTKTFEKKFNFGDGLVLSDSATYSGWINSDAKKFAYNDGVILDVKVDRTKGALAAEISIDNPSVKSLHAELLTRPDSKSKIVCLVSKENTSDCN